MASVFIRRPCEDRNAGRGLCEDRGWSDTFVSQRMTKILPDHQQLGRGKDSPTGFRGSVAQIGSQTTSFGNQDITGFCCFKPPTVQYFIIAALQNGQFSIFWNWTLINQLEAFYVIILSLYSPSFSHMVRKQKVIRIYSLFLTFGVGKVSHSK